MSDETNPKNDAVKILNHIRGAELEVAVKLRSKTSTLGELHSLTPGAVVMFDEESVETGYITLNDQTLAKGTVVQVGDHYGLKVDEVMS